MNKPTVRIKDYCILCLCIMHLLIIFIVCVNSSISNYISFYDIEKKGFNKVILEISSSVLNAPLIKEYSTCAGVNAGYGFFAPNVASEYVLEFKLYDQQNILLEIRRLPAFQNKESIIRYSTMLGSFQDKLLALNDPKKSTSIKIRYLNVIIKSMGRNIMKNNEGIKRIIATLYLYEFPSLQKYRSGHKDEELIPFERFDLVNK